MTKVRIAGCERGARTISAIHEVRHATGLGLAEAKKTIDDALDRSIVVFELNESVVPEKFALKMKEFGFSVEIKISVSDIKAE